MHTPTRIAKPIRAMGSITVADVGPTWLINASWDETKAYLEASAGAFRISLTSKARDEFTMESRESWVGVQVQMGEGGGWMSGAAGVFVASGVG